MSKKYSVQNTGEKLTNIDDRGFRALQAAICLCAVQDYKCGLRNIIKDGRNTKQPQEFHSAKRFITGSMFEKFCGINGEKALKTLEDQVKEEMRRKGYV